MYKQPEDTIDNDSLQPHKLSSEELKIGELMKISTSSKFSLQLEIALHELQLHRHQKPQTHAKVILLEGLDGCGKTTLTNQLLQSLSESPPLHIIQPPINVVTLRTPPPEITKWRCEFDAKDENTRRAFYLLGNILISKQLRELDASHIVILDRYYPSTYAYEHATKQTLLSSQTTEEDDDDDGGEWPWYLVKPTLMIMLEVNEELRRERIKERNLQLTKEEIDLQNEAAFRQLVTSKYLMISDIHRVDASLSPSLLADHILSLLSSQSRNLNSNLP